MTNSEKAFEEWVYNGFEYVKENSQYFEDMKSAWSAAIEFSAKVCREGVHWCPDFKNEIHEITKQTCQRLEEEIRKRGAV